MYWATDTITSSLLPYWAHNHVPGSGIPAGDPSPVPTAVTIFGGERVPFPKPPRELAERYYKVTAWAEHPVGGHFPPSPNPTYSPASCATRSGRCATKPDPSSSSHKPLAIEAAAELPLGRPGSSAGTAPASGSVEPEREVLLLKTTARVA